MSLLAAIERGDVSAVRTLLAAGDNPRVGDGTRVPLHVAAERGPLVLVETLIAGGALVWQLDGHGRTALDAARAGHAPDRAAIVDLLDRNRIIGASFRAAVDAIHAGNVADLERLLAAHPALLHERNEGPEAYRLAERFDYFRDPKVFWYIANNPMLVDRISPTMLEIATVMIDRGVEQGDLDYTLGLIATSASARTSDLQVPLMKLLHEAGAHGSSQTILSTAAHGELVALRAFLDLGEPLTLPIAAALGDVASLSALLPDATSDEVTVAFGLAVINDEIAAARLALEAGADVDAPLPVHTHSTALHQAAAADHPEMIALLLAHGASTTARDTLWDGTPLDWARYAGKSRAERALRGHSGRPNGDV